MTWTILGCRWCIYSAVTGAASHILFNMILCEMKWMEHLNQSKSKTHVMNLNASKNILFVKHIVSLAKCSCNTIWFLSYISRSGPHAHFRNYMLAVDHSWWCDVFHHLIVSLVSWREVLFLRWRMRHFFTTSHTWVTRCWNRMRPSWKNSSTTTMVSMVTEVCVEFSITLQFLHTTHNITPFNCISLQYSGTLV